MKFVFNVSGWLQNFNIFSMYWRKFFCPDAGCQRLSYTSGFKKLLYAPIGALLTKYSFKPIGAYKSFLKPDVYDNLWHIPHRNKKIFVNMKNMLKFCSHPETLKTNFIEYV